MTTQTTQERQLRVLTLCYRARPGTARLSSLNAEYDRLVAVLESELGAGAHCNDVDPSLYSLFSDWHKDVAGFRPRGHITRADVQAWCARESSPEARAAREAAMAEEDAFYEDIMHENSVNEIEAKAEAAAQAKAEQYEAEQDEYYESFYK